MNPPDGRKYSRAHVWALPEAGGDFRVGLTHVPGVFLGDAVFVELPPRQTEVFAGEPIGLVESSFTVFEVVSPLTGTVVELNPGVESVPRRVTKDPYGEGWLLTIRPSGGVDPGSLMDGEEYERYAVEG